MIRPTRIILIVHILVIIAPTILVLTGCISMSKREQNALEAFNQANVFKEAGQLDEAIESYRKTLKLRPTITSASFNLALTLADMDNFDESLKILNRLERQDPRNTRILQTKGWVYRKAERYDEAIAAYNAVLDIFSNDSTAIRSLADIEERQGQINKAITQMEKLLIIDDSVENHTILARLYGIQKYPQAVLQEYQWIDIHGKLDTKARLDAGKTAEQLGLFDEAIKYYRQVGTSNTTESIEAWYLMTKLQLVTLQDYASGLASLEQALSLGFQDDKAIYNLILEVPPDIHPSIELLLAKQEETLNTNPSPEEQPSDQSTLEDESPPPLDPANPGASTLQDNQPPIDSSVPTKQ